MVHAADRGFRACSERRGSCTPLRAAVLLLTHHGLAYVCVFNIKLVRTTSKPCAWRPKRIVYVCVLICMCGFICCSTSRRLLLLDYDGTLIPHRNISAAPPAEVSPEGHVEGPANTHHYWVDLSLYKAAEHAQGLDSPRLIFCWMVCFGVYIASVLCCSVQQSVKLYMTCMANVADKTCMLATVRTNWGQPFVTGLIGYHQAVSCKQYTCMSQRNTVGVALSECHMLTLQVSRVVDWRPCCMFC